MPAADSSAGGGASGVQTQTNTASAPVMITRSCAGTLLAPKNGAATSAAPIRVMTKSSRQNSASTPPKPKFSEIIAKRPQSERRSRG